VIAPLVDPAAHGGNPADAFHVICPSLPGFGFSAKPKTTGWGVDRIAATWAKLMDRLGYARYGAQGGDWGSAVTTSLGAQDAEHCAGIHITLAFNAAPKVEGEPTAEEKRALAGLKHYVDLDSGYSKQQSTRPQTLGYGLTDSPSGQAAWILEKFWAWTDCDGHPENILTRTSCSTTSCSIGRRRRRPPPRGSTGRVLASAAPTPGRTCRPASPCSPKEIITPVRRWMEPNFPNITHWSEMEKGGHFAAFEQPELYVGDVRKFFQTVRR
jgi:pimeloyl-ACP methyl ester carboxylesterase